MTSKNPHNKEGQLHEGTDLNRLQISVGDLLHKQGSKDSLSLAGLRLHDTITNFVGTIEIVSISSDELYVTLKNASYELTIPCDYCGTIYVATKHLPQEGVCFMLEHLITPQLQEEEIVFPIGSDMVIDIQPLLQQMIGLANDVQHACPACHDRLSSLDDEEYNLPDSSLSSSIIFT